MTNTIITSGPEWIDVEAATNEMKKLDIISERKIFFMR
jgi:hypothetical protein